METRLQWIAPEKKLAGNEYSRKNKIPGEAQQNDRSRRLRYGVGATKNRDNEKNIIFG